MSLLSDVYLLSTREGWEAWWRLQALAEGDFGSRVVACTGCGARRNEPCLSATGLQASEPCDVRVRDAAQMQKSTKEEAA